MWRRTDPDPSGTPETRAMPRDVEVLERVVEALTEASTSIGEVEDLARETAAATQRVSDRIAGIRTSSDRVTAGTHATSEVVGRPDAVQARITDVLEEQVRMARAVGSAA
ncbi:hypothetical protein ACI8AK_22320 [Geodermatophilus sp. SYSU D00867]